MMAGGEIQLPEHIIQHVQYFLTSKEAARTSVLSKSWGSAWLTRPNLDFDFGRRDFNKGREDRDSFLTFTEKTLKRYEDSNLKIESFRLCTLYLYWSCHPDQIRNMIVRALKLGATRLASYTDYSMDFVIPIEVFASENLVELTLERCQIDLEPNRDVIRCSRLQSLSLEFMRAQGYGEINFHDTLLRIISSCPLLEKFSLSHDYNSRDDIADVLDHDIVLPRLRSLVLAEVGPATLFLFMRGLSSSFPSLKDLTLEMYTRYEEGQDKVEMLIASPSLERLHLKIERNQTWRFKFDVPSIRKFTFVGTSIPSVSFRSTSRAWESHVLIKHYKSMRTSWFRKLSKLLKKLRRSRIHLSLHVWSVFCSHYMVGDIQGWPTRSIENLTINLDNFRWLNCYALLDGLFLMCRPKSITPLKNIDFVGETLLQAGLHREQYLEIQARCPEYSRSFPYRVGDIQGLPTRMIENLTIDLENLPSLSWYALLDGLFLMCRPKSITPLNNVDFIGETILQAGLNHKISTPKQFMYGLKDLEEATVQIFDADVSQWRNVPLHAFLGDSTSTPAEDKRDVRFQLKWQS